MKAKMSKKSTLTITIMACLLAVAVATTIVLAAFSANKTVTTTITFSNGVQLKITGASQQDTGNPDDVLSTSATLNWNVILTPYIGGDVDNNSSASTDKSGEVGGTNGLDGSSKVDLAAISLDVAGTGNATIYLAAKPVVKYTTDGTTPSASTGTDVTISSFIDSGWSTTGAESGWYLKSVTLSGGSSTNNAFSSLINLYTPQGTSADNTFAGRKYYATIEFEASTVAIHTSGS